MSLPASRPAGGYEMEVRCFKKYVELVADCFYHDSDRGENGHYSRTPHDVLRARARAALTYFDCPEPWQDIVLLCSEGAHYYGYEHLFDFSHTGDGGERANLTSHG